MKPSHYSEKPFENQCDAINQDPNGKLPGKAPSHNA